MTTIIIPCHTYIRKYIQAHYQQGIDLLPLRRDSFIGGFVINLLDRSYQFRKSGLYQDQVVFYVGELIFKRYGSNMTDANVNFFNRTIDNMFRESMYRAIDLAISVKVDYKDYGDVKSLKKQRKYRRKYVLVNRSPDIYQCIIDYCRMFGITEEDIMMETLKKSYYRYRRAYDRRSKVFGS